MPAVTMTLTKDQAAQLRHHLCVAFNHWTEQARHAQSPADEKLCNSIANGAIELFALCLSVDDNIQKDDIENVIR